MGLSHEEITACLSEDTSTIDWKHVPKDGILGRLDMNKDQKGQIDLVNSVKCVKSSGDNGIAFFGIDNKIFFDIKAKDNSIRDKWLVAISELQQYWEENPSAKVS